MTSAKYIPFHTGIVRVWYLLLEGLTGAVTTCPRQYQPQTLYLLFELLKSVTNVPGPEFAVFAVTHLLLPMIHSWLRRGSCVRGFWETSVANFRHATGLSTDLVVDHINFVSNDEILVTYIGCVIQCVAFIASVMDPPCSERSLWRSPSVIMYFGYTCSFFIPIRPGPLLYPGHTVLQLMK